MSVQMDTTGVCPSCKHMKQDHVSWGGQPHYHGKEMRECSHMHVYCMVPDCHCSGVIVKDLRQKAP
jgi:hypothetical protein